MIAPRSAIAAGKLAMRGPSAAASSTLSSTAALAHGRRAFSSSRSALANTLLFVEHKKGKLNPTSLSAVTAAQKLGGDVHAVVVGEEDFHLYSFSNSSCRTRFSIQVPFRCER